MRRPPTSARAESAALTAALGKRPSPTVPGPLRPGCGGGRRGRAPGLCAGKHKHWGRICVLPDGHEASMREPHWGRTSEGQPIA